MRATVRNLARAAFTTLGALELCLLRRRSSPFRLFRLCSVQAMETCIASPAAHGPSQKPQHRQSGEVELGGFLLGSDPSWPPPSSWGSRNESWVDFGAGAAGAAAVQDRARRRQKYTASPEVVTAAGARMGLANPPGQ